MPFIGPKPADTVLDSTLIADGTITSAKIADGAIVNADLNSSAAIATSKISGLAASATTDTTNAANISSGTIADARISASSVNQHATSFDDNKLVNDISTLALRQSSNENRAAYNTNSMYVDVFQDATGITNLTTSARDDAEFIHTQTSSTATASNGSTTFVDASDENHTITQSNSQWDNAVGGALGGSVGIYNRVGSNNGYLNIANTNSFLHQFGSSDFTIELFGYNLQSDSHRGILGYDDGGVQAWQFATNPTLSVRWWASNDGSNWNMGSNNYITANNNPSNQWVHMAVVRSGNNFYGYSAGTRRDSWSGSGALVDENSAFRVGATGNVTNVHHGYIDQIRISNTARYTGSTYTVPSGTNGYTNDANTKLIIGSKYQTTTTNATGSFESNAITAPSSVSSMGAIITYQDNAGTNALNTDIVLKLSADNGSNYSTATLVAMPDFATGIKMAKVNDLSVTAGTSLKYKLEFANQASGSKEARIRGVSLQY